MNQFEIKYKIWLETADKKGILGNGKWKLLKAINETGSLKEAMIKLNLSYRKTWDNLRKIEQLLGFRVVEKTRGGITGGKTVLTPQGKIIVTAFDKFHRNHDAAITKALNDMLIEIRQNVGEHN
jgi:molybdate transport repressor ModE-like protein